MIHPAVLLAALPYVKHACAHQFSQPNCTLPQQDLHNFVSAPNIRGTLEIIWTCLATIIACTYTVLHLNVPEQRDGRDMDKGWRGDLKWWWKGIQSSAMWTAITVLAPEVYTITAFEDFNNAKVILKRLSSLPNAFPDPKPTLVHAHHINMGGFAIRIATQPSPKDAGPQQRPDSSLIALQGSSVIDLLKDRSWTKPTLPSKAEILDKSKSDVLAKAIVTVQVLYFCASCVTRAARHLPLSLFELGTVGFAACSLVTYGFLFQKPRSVNTPFVMAHFDHDIPRQVEDVLTKNQRLRRVENNPPDLDVPEVFGVQIALFVGVFTATALGAIHLAGWNFEFPTEIDKWIWRASSVASVVFSMSFLVGAWLLKSTYDSTTRVLVYGSTAIYTISRLAIIVEMVRCLFYLPPEAFTATWTANMPHLG